MKKLFRFSLLAVACLLLTAFAAHKFYVGIYQVNFVPEKKMLQITSRVFVDDVNDVLKQKHKREFRIGETAETAEDVTLMKQYFAENMTVKIDGKQQQLQFMSKEIENNVLICYFRCTGIARIKMFEIKNKILIDLVTEQQNIIQTNINGEKKSILLTVDNTTEVLKY
jgi:hypothetical protein